MNDFLELVSPRLAFFVQPVTVCAFQHHQVAGKTLRRFSLDELPQLYNIFKGELSFVGPRPALFNQDDLIALRTENNVHLIMPGLTGWAQICGRDSLSIREKVEHDVYYAEHRSIWFDVKIIWLTIFRVVTGDGIRN